MMLAGLILHALSQSLIINCTCRKNFGHANVFGEIDIVSLFFVNLGPIRLYFISYDRTNKNFKIIRKIKYSEITKWPTGSDIDDVMQRQSAKFTDANLIAIEYKLSTEIERFSIITNKMPNYITIIVFAIPLYYALFSLFSQSLLSKMMSTFAAYLLVGCVSIMYVILSIKKIVRSDLNEMIANQAKAKYFDWQIRKRENDFYAGLVKNLELAFFVSMIFAILATGIGLASKSDSATKPDPLKVVSDSTKIKSPIITVDSVVKTKSLPEVSTAHVKPDSLPTNTRNANQVQVDTSTQHPKPQPSQRKTDAAGN